MYQFDLIIGLAQHAVHNPLETVALMDLFAIVIDDVHLKVLNHLLLHYICKLQIHICKL